MTEHPTPPTDRTVDERPRLDPVWGLVRQGPYTPWKRFLKRSIARTFAIGTSASDPRRGVAVLAYHGTSDEPGDPWWVDFRGQMALLERLDYDVVPLARAVEIVLSGRTPARPTVALTFDDGYHNNLSSAFAELARRGWPASVFLASSLVDRRPYLRREEIRDLEGMGIEVGNHTHTHPDLRGLDAGTIADEIRTCQDRLAEITGYRPRHFVFPNGRYSPTACAVIRECGLEAACTGRFGVNGPGTDPFRLRRLTLERGDTAADLEVRLRGGYDFLDARQRFMDEDP